MTSKNVTILAAVIGAICGLGATFPVELRFLPSMFLWGIGGIVVGLLVEERRVAIRCGIVYGAMLAVSFLFSRYGGKTLSQFLSYSVLVIGLSIVASFAGIIAGVAGAAIRKRMMKKV